MTSSAVGRGSRGPQAPLHTVSTAGKHDILRAWRLFGLLLVPLPVWLFVCLRDRTFTLQGKQPRELHVA